MSTPKRPTAIGGVVYALAAAALFGASTPFAKLLAGTVDPLVLAGLLDLGSGVGLTAWRGVRRLRAAEPPEASLGRADVPWLAGAILAGGVAAPVLLMVGLARTPAATSSLLLLNLEGVLTAVLAWVVFRENFDRRIALGMACITAGGSPGGRGAVGSAGDRRCLPRLGGGQQPHPKGIGGRPDHHRLAQGVDRRCGEPRRRRSGGGDMADTEDRRGGRSSWLLGHGDSLTLFVLALRHLGTARTGAYFSTAPFVGAAVSLVMFRDVLSPGLLTAGILMSVGVWLHLTERHEHEHEHEEMFHDHRHVHDDHHRHEHDGTEPPGEPHSHPHYHPPMRHSHPHYPDIHHRHSH
jgi:drug/metabolite transporter (DMT)-like permease